MARVKPSEVQAIVDRRRPAAWEAAYARRLPASGPHRTARRPRRLLVVGGGPAGVAAATAGARVGYSVILAESTDRLGGQLVLAGSSAARRTLWQRWLGWAHTELQSRAVDVRMNTTVKAEDCSGYDRVVIATGARAGHPVRVPGRAVTLDAWTAIARPSPLIGSVLVLDREGEWSALDAAEILATHGYAVTLATASETPGHWLRRCEQDAFRTRLTALGVRVLPRQELVIPSATSPAVIRHVHSGRTHPLDSRLGAIVVAAARAPESHLWSRLRGRPGIVRVGDAVAPRTLEDAIIDGTRSVTGSMCTV
ncbi:FAD-dependent oxidoreductase [Streptomyces sp. NPDC051776]|uniref:FAD-dependent oxidoreductase n=1 Tax=Streptomyces sp. NPDC051776 TaxID=3155414 RepID=UPI00342AE145